MKATDNKYGISIVITCFNEGEKIYDALNSVKRQTYRDFELIVVNDSSLDPITNHICDLLVVEGIKVVKTENNIGPSGARNKGITEASGDIIIPLDADDLLPETAVENIFNTFIKYEYTDYVFGDYLRKDIEKGITSYVDCSFIADDNFEINPKKLLENWLLLGMSPFRKSLWSKLNGYSLEFSFTCQDVDFQMRSILANSKSRYIKHIIYEWNKSETGINSSTANLNALSKCYYNNFEFLLNYSIHNDAFSIAVKYLDYYKIKQWAYKLSSESKETFKSRIFYHIPLALMPVIISLYLFQKKIRNQIFYFSF